MNDVSGSKMSIVVLPIARCWKSQLSGCVAEQRWLARCWDGLLDERSLTGTAVAVDRSGEMCESAAALSCRQEPPSREEAAAVIISHGSMIIRDLLAASETYSKSARRTEEHTKAQLLAGITAFLHAWE